MSKALEVLKDIREHSGKEIVKCVWEDNAGYSKTITINDLCDLIETELKDYEETDNLLCDLCEKFGINNEKDLLKKLQALEAIKELFDCGYLQFKYGQIVSAGTNDDSSYPLTKEKNDLLKKVLL